MKLSIIIPLYNSVKHIDLALKSCFEQKMSVPWEVVMCDDGSTDGTYKYVVSKYGSNPHCKIFRHDTNGGQTRARETCFNNASGDWFFTLDHDNALAENLIEKLIRRVTSSGLDACSPQELRFFKRGVLQKVGEWVFNYAVCDFSQMIISTSVPPSGGQYLFSRKMYEAVGGYPELTEDAQGDWGFGFKHVALGYPIAICPGTFYWHQNTENSMWYNIVQAKWHQQVTNTLLKYIDKFDADSRKLIESGQNGYRLINDGKLRPK